MSSALALFLGGWATAQDAPAMPKPQKEHEWLSRLVGEWDAEGECRMDPAKPPMKFKGTESARAIGGFWVQLENRAEFMGAPFTGILSLGFDPQKKAYVATWLDSMSSYLWKYTGSVDASGNVLTLEAEGPCCLEPGKLVRHREVTELRGKDLRVFTSSTEMNGTWVTAMTITYRRRGSP